MQRDNLEEFLDGWSFKDKDELQEILATKKYRRDTLDGVLGRILREVRDYNYNTMFLFAKLLLDAKANPNGKVFLPQTTTCPAESMPFLRYAVELGHPDLVKSLIDKRAIPSQNREDKNNLINKALFFHFVASHQQEALVAWHLFIAGVPLVPTVLAKNAILPPKFKGGSLNSYFIFLTALNTLWISEKRYQAVSQTILQVVNIKSIADIIRDYSEGNQKDHNTIESQIVTIPHLFEPLDEKEFLNAPPLMTAARKGDSQEVRHLLEAKADLTVSTISGNSALIWCMHGGNTEGHASVAQQLIESLEKKPDSSSSSCAIS